MMKMLGKLLRATLLAAALCSASITATANEFEGNPAAMQARLGVMSQYLSIVESLHAIASDPEKDVIFIMQQLENGYKKSREFGKIVAMYQKVLADSSNQTVRNVAYMKLGEIYRRGGKDAEAEKLLNQALKENMKKVR